jgi:hypothetical protein
MMMLNQGRIGSSLLNLDVAATPLSGLAPSGGALDSSALSSLSDTGMHTPKKATHSAYRSAEFTGPIYYQPIRKPWFDLSGFYETADGCQVKSIPSMYIF